MKLTTWKARGLNAPSRKRLLKHNIKYFNSNVILIQESKLNSVEIDKFIKMLGVWCSLFQVSLGASRGLGMLWDPRKVNIKILNCSKNWISGKVQSLKSDLNFTIINVYDLVNNTNKQLVCNEIGQFLDSLENELFILGGDFNMILDINEKIGGSQVLSQALRDFK